MFLLIPQAVLNKSKRNQSTLILLWIWLSHHDKLQPKQTKNTQRGVLTSVSGSIDYQPIFLILPIVVTVTHTSFDPSSWSLSLLLILYLQLYDKANTFFKTNISLHRFKNDCPCFWNPFLWTESSSYQNEQRFKQVTGKYFRYPHYKKDPLFTLLSVMYIEHHL